MTISLDHFLDIHTHILPGLDDGAKNMQESLALARCYERVGIKKIIATPHFLPGTAWAPSKDKVLQSVQALQMKLDDAHIDVHVGAGMEIAFHKKMEERILDKSLLPLSESGYFLVEPSFFGEQVNLLVTLNSLLQKGQKLILAHPERVEQFQKHPELLRNPVSLGLRIQVNAASLLGYLGQKCKSTAELLHQMNCLHFIASDAHDRQNRPPLDDAAWEKLLDSREGREMLHICMQNIAENFTKSSTFAQQNNS